MKKSSFNIFRAALLAIMVITNPLFAAKNHRDNDLCFNHLSEINKEWDKYISASPAEHISFSSDADRIQLHLRLVCKHLLDHTPSGLTKKQLTNRLQLIRELKMYAENKVFPTNKYHSTRQPYFVDENNVHCAVGYLIAVSGHEDLVSRIRREHNYDYIEDIKTPGVLDWANEYGFTLDELKWIQPTYGPSVQIDTIGHGANNTVNEVVYDYWGQRVIFAGEFDSLDHLPCLQLGYYKDGQLSCLGNGVNGVIKDLFPRPEGVYVFGGLLYGGDVYPGAFYDGTAWSYLSIPGRDGATCTAADSGPYGYKYQVAISHSSIPGKQEIWSLTTENVWHKQAEVNGIVLDMESTSNGFGKAIGGHFDTLTVYFPGGIIDTTFTVYNVAIKEYGIQWYGLTDQVSDTVKVIKEIGGSLFLGGTCSSAPGLSNVCLTRYYNGTLQPLFLRDNYMGPVDYSVNAISFDGGYKMIIGGYFFIDAGLTYGRHLGAYNLISNSFVPMSVFDEQVNGLAFMGNTLYMGGDFTNNGSWDPINYIARTTSYTEINETVSAKNVKVYPNPFTHKITIEGISEGTPYSIVNASGQLIQSGELQEKVISNLEELPAGLYFLKLETEEGLSVHRLVK